MMSNTYIFRIRNLEVKYGEHRVLYVPNLDIPRGKFIFLLGHSGSGKTTFIETLGLMSTNFQPMSQILFYPTSQSEGIDYRHIVNNEDKLAELRRNHFMFMFQEHYLFPHFDVKSNVSLTQIIDNLNFVDIERSVVQKLNELEITHKTSDFISKMSGGERQRASFARAVLAGGTIFFADEPTGNLGRSDAHNVMKNIREYVDSNPENTAIVVSHNIEHALLYGDQIIIIHEHNHCISEQNILISQRKEDEVIWYNSLGDSIFSLKQFDTESRTIVENIEKQMDSNGVQIPDEVHSEVSIVLNNNYEKNIDYDDKKFRDFFGPVSTQELSIRKKNSYVLIAILTLSFLAIGFSVGSLQVLQDKMQDPFINWITVEIPYDKLKDVGQIQGYLGADTTMKKFSIRSVGGFFREPMNFYNKERNGTIVCIGRTIDVTDPIIRDLSKPENVISGTFFTQTYDIGIIVTPEFMKLCGIESGNPFTYASIYTGDSYAIVPIPIKAVVKNLPSQSQFLMTEYFYCKKNSGSFNPHFTSELIIFCEGKRENAQRIKDELLKFIESKSEFTTLSPYVFLSKLDSSQLPSVEGNLVKVSFLEQPSWEITDKIYSQFIETVKDTPFHTYHLYNYPSTALSESEVSSEYNRLSIHVENLEQINTLRAALMEKGLEIDLAKIESLNNFNFVAKLTNTLSVIIIFISIVSVCIFMGYILYVFLYKNRMYIGMLKAFGLPRKTLRLIYLQRMGISLILATFISFILSLLLGYSKAIRSILSFLNFTIDSYYSYFDLFNTQLIIFIVCLFALSFVSLLFTANYILDRSPGELIYDRIENQ